MNSVLPRLATCEIPVNGPPTAPASPRRTGGLLLSLWCVSAAFGTYFCMYGFRKPFTAADDSDFPLAGAGYKALLVTAQVLGYTLSKFIGIKVIAEMTPQRRAGAIVWLTGLAWLALVLFALTPPPVNVVFLFLNGLPLGLVFGLVMGFLEGRQVTEALVAGLCASFILADGVTRSAGAYLLTMGVSAFWMPAAAGLLFAPPLLLSVWMLARIPPPTAADTVARSERAPMNAAGRWHFLASYGPGLALIVAAYLLVTILRSIRADFAQEIWKGLGVSGQPEVFAISEICVGIGVMLLNGLAVLLSDNRRAFGFATGLAIAGLCLIGVTLAGLSAGWLTPFAFMVLIGLGLYIPYVAVHTTIFERLIAMTRDRGNIGYLMYLADAFGYLGYATVMLVRNFTAAGGGMLEFFLACSGVGAVAGIAALGLGWMYFTVHPAVRPQRGTPCRE